MPQKVGGVSGEKGVGLITTLLVKMFEKLKVL